MRSVVILVLLSLHLAALATLATFATLAAAEPWFELTSWPAVVYADEAHHLAFRLTTEDAGTVRMHWGIEQAFSIPAGGGEGLLTLSTVIGVQHGEVRFGTQSAELAVHLADVSDPWPIVSLRHGLPVDANGVPVVLVDHRRGPNTGRRERLATGTVPRPDDNPILVGDPLRAFADDTWRGLHVDLRPAIDERFPQNDALRALAHLARPRSIVWSPGNGALFAGTWADEGRLCSALASRCAALQIRPRLVVALPPLPVTASWRAEAVRRNQALAQAAMAAGWMLLDLAAIAGDPAQANHVSDGLFADYPIRLAQERLREAIRDELRR